MVLSQQKKDLLDKIFTLYELTLKTKDKYDPSELYTINLEFIQSEKIKDSLDKIFEDCPNKIAIDELDSVIKNSKTLDLLLTYLDKCNVEIDYIVDEKYLEDDSLAVYLKEISQYTLYTREEEIRAFEELKETQSEVARENIINHNLKLVIYFAKKYHGAGLSLLDLIQEGNIGLMKAIEKFDVTKGYKFSTYAANWIKHDINNAVMSKGRMIHLPTYMNQKVYTFRRVRSALYQELNREPTIDEIADSMGIDFETAKNLKELINEPLSLQQSTNEDDTVSLMDNIADSNNVLEKEKIDCTLLNEKLHTIINNDRKYNILCDTFGLNDHTPLSIKEIATKYKTSKESIAKINCKSLIRIRVNKDFKDSFNDY